MFIDERFTDYKFLYCFDVRKVDLMNRKVDEVLDLAMCLNTLWPLLRLYQKIRICECHYI